MSTVDFPVRARREKSNPNVIATFTIYDPPIDVYETAEEVNAAREIPELTLANSQLLKLVEMAPPKGFVDADEERPW